MNYYITLTLIALITSCSHIEHDHSEHDHSKNHREHIVWEKEDKVLSDDYKKALSVFSWFKEHIKEHELKVSKHLESIAQHEEIMNTKNLSKLERSKNELLRSRQHEEMGEDHRHFMKDHAEFMGLIIQLENLKEELESHEGHNH